ncbi:MAG: hypothetical protein R3199_06730 [Gemmatimonadota bacterium]|nr:hypothetical protein [Gemmatimonadota bacterium]
MSLSKTPTALALLAALALACQPAQEGEPGAADTAEPAADTVGEEGAKPDVEKLVKLAPGRGWLEAHDTAPQPLLGGPVTVEVSQEGGGVFVALPAKRSLDDDVFGVPDLPRAWGGTPGINGVPPGAREVTDGKFGQMKNPTPFGDESMGMTAVRLRLTATDATATDASSTNDRVRFEASWSDGEENTYTVRCCEQLAARGVEYPTFGGVVTNHVLHGFSRIGTALMPTEFAYVAFWGMGQVMKNGEVVAAPRLVHGMVTEYVRGEGYTLVHDSGVDPTQKHFHLMVPPMMPDREAGRFHHEDLPTGFTLPNGEELPFWHVMFEDLEISASRGG